VLVARRLLQLSWRVILHDAALVGRPSLATASNGASSSIRIDMQQLAPSPAPAPAALLLPYARQQHHPASSSAASHPSLALAHQRPRRRPRQAPCCCCRPGPRPQPQAGRTCRRRPCQAAPGPCRPVHRRWPAACPAPASGCRGPQERPGPSRPHAGAPAGAVPGGRLRRGPWRWPARQQAHAQGPRQQVLLRGCTRCAGLHRRRGSHQRVHWRAAEGCPCIT
jgi:hypothetical protein